MDDEGSVKKYIVDEEEEEEEDGDVRNAEEACGSTPELTAKEVKAGMERMYQYQNQQKFSNPAPDEDCNMPSWKARKKQVFVFSNAGKPIFSRYGDEQKMSTFFAAAQAILSFVSDKWKENLLEIEGSSRQQTEPFWNRKEQRQIAHQRTVFLERGPLTFVCSAKTGETREQLRSQLELLHSQFISILTLGIERAFQKSAKFDMRQLLGGTEPLLRSVIHNCSWELPIIFDGLAPLPLNLDLRKAIAQTLQGAFVPDLMCSLLFTKDRLICVSSRKRFKLHRTDLFLFLNFVRLNESFRQNESFTPFCFPNFNANAFLYVYISYINEDICLAMISGRSDSFHELSSSREFIQRYLEQESVKSALQNAFAETMLTIPELPMSAGGGRVGLTPLWHYVYVHKKLRQLLSPKFSVPLLKNKVQKSVLRHYKDMKAALQTGDEKTQNTVRWRKNKSFVMIACVSSDFDLYAVFDLIVTSDEAVRICNQLTQYLMSKEANLLLPLFQLKSSSRVTNAARQASLSPGKRNFSIY